MKYFWFGLLILFLINDFISHLSIKKDINREFNLLINMSLLDATTAKVITPEQEKQIEEIFDANAKRLGYVNK